MAKCELHPSICEKLQWFTYDHLPPHLAEVSEKFANLAHELVGPLALDGAQVTIALQKLIEAKDAAVRAAKVRYDLEQEKPNG
jgi:hypothetical protein